MDIGLIAAFWTDPATWWAIAQVVLGLGAVIFVHELGHFLVAKACGVKCEKFYLGFDMFDVKIGDRVIIPRSLLKWKWGETVYGIGIVPLGGYVKMLGQDDNPARAAEERKRSMLEQPQSALADQPAGQDGQADQAAPGGRGRSSGRGHMDPRSYQAKSVPQRMAIISAGVVMNLIFAVIFAAIAFNLGVNYEPPDIGSTVPGAPAWVHNLDGASVLSVNGQSTTNKYFTFGHLREAIVLDSADDKPVDLVVRFPGQQQPVALQVPTITNLFNIKGARQLPGIGIGPPSTTTLSKEQPVVPGQAAALSQPPFAAGDVITHIQGEKVANGYELRRALSRNATQPLNVTVQRSGDAPSAQTQLDIQVPVNYARSIGVQMKTGPVAAVQLNSPAAVAGIAKGDELVSIDGQAIGDIFTLQQRMVAAAQQSQSPVFRVRRSTSDSTPEEIDLPVRPRLPDTISTIVDERPLAIDSLGIAVNVLNQVELVSRDDDVDLAAGDWITKVEFVLGSEQQKDEFFVGFEQPFDLEKAPTNWPVVHRAMQFLEADAVVKLTRKRNGQEQTVVRKVNFTTDVFQPSRGMLLTVQQDTYQAATAWEAIQLGLFKTYEDATKVLRFLEKLIRGEISVTSLGGPGTIAAAATAEATQGTSRLLLFLTLLSANLAIINFLPIPVLDGGHMMFLCYEGIFRRPVSERLQIILSFAGLIFIVGLMVLVISLDVWRWT